MDLVITTEAVGSSPTFQSISHCTVRIKANAGVLEITVLFFAFTIIRLLRFMSFEVIRQAKHISK